MSFQMDDINLDDEFVMSPENLRRMYRAIEEEKDITKKAKLLIKMGNIRGMDNKLSDERKKEILKDPQRFVDAWYKLGEQCKERHEEYERECRKEYNRCHPLSDKEYSEDDIKTFNQSIDYMISKLGKNN